MGPAAKVQSFNLLRVDRRQVIRLQIVHVLAMAAVRMLLPSVAPRLLARRPTGSIAGLSATNVVASLIVAAAQVAKPAKVVVVWAALDAIL
jgi:hypothetical protein